MAGSTGMGSEGNNVNSLINAMSAFGSGSGGDSAWQGTGLLDSKQTYFGVSSLS